MAVVSLIRIRTLANAGVPLSEVGRLLEADAPAFAEAVQRIGSRLRDEIERLESSRKQIAQLAAGDRLVRLYRVLSELLESDAADDPLLEEAADVMAGLFEQAYASGELNLGEVAHDDLAIDVLDALFVESDPRTERMLDLMRERGWAGWTWLERLAEPPG